MHKEETYRHTDTHRHAGIQTYRHKDIKRRHTDIKHIKHKHTDIHTDIQTYRYIGTHT